MANSKNNEFMGDSEKVTSNQVSNSTNVSFSVAHTTPLGNTSELNYKKL